jgi:hypothetical protein
MSDKALQSPLKLSLLLMTYPGAQAKNRDAQVNVSKIGFLMRVQVLRSPNLPTLSRFSTASLLLWIIVTPNHRATSQGVITMAVQML